MFLIATYVLKLTELTYTYYALLVWFTNTHDGNWDEIIVHSFWVGNDVCHRLIFPTTWNCQRTTITPE